MIGSTLGRYEVTGKLGEGGMGVVWRAVDRSLGREVALKLLPEAVADDADRLARLHHEARVLASLSHANIATLYGLEEVGGQAFLVLQLVSGADLQERIARGPMPVDEVVDVAVQICDALAAAHAAGIVHRDLKPSNIRLDASGTVKVLDFGLAKAWQRRAPARDGDASSTPTRVPEATVAGMVLGTAAYMAPEQARGGEVDNRSDIWSFGVVLWEMLAGAPPFRGATVADLIAAVLREEPPWERLPSHVPDSLRRLLRRCLRRDPARRLHHIVDARLELEEAREPSPRTSAATPTRTTARAWTLSSELCRRLDRAHLDPGIIGDQLHYLDNGRRSDVLVAYLPGFGFGHGTFERVLEQSPYRGIAISPYGFQESCRRRIPLPFADHLTILRAFLAHTVAEIWPKVTILVGYSSGGDVAMRLVAEGGVGPDLVSGLLSISPNLDLGTCFVSLRVARVTDGRQLLDVVREVAAAATTPQEWLALVPYLSELMRKYHADMAALRRHALDITDPFHTDGDSPFAGWYRAVKDAAVPLRVVFAGVDGEQRPLRQTLLGQVDRQILGPHFDHGDIVSEHDCSHLDLMDPDLITRHTEALLERIAAAR